MESTGALKVAFFEHKLLFKVCIFRCRQVGPLNISKTVLYIEFGIAEVFLTEVNQHHELHREESMAGRLSGKNKLTSLPLDILTSHDAIWWASGEHEKGIPTLEA